MTAVPTSELYDKGEAELTLSENRKKVISQSQEFTPVDRVA